MKRAILFLCCLTPVLIHSAGACPVCYGANDSPMNAGMNTALGVMLGITGGVLGFIAAFFVMMWKRYRRQRERLSGQTFIDDHGVLRTKHEKGVMEWNNF
ncbi:MAG: hypothetical protein E6K56_03470 [Ignavibacteria bacterium]|nr:MAG: hypothetical protein E6K56_03470 [Ignavibacteria bacterium]